MKSKNTFTYRQSELPEFPLEIKSEIAALDAWAASIIQKSVGNYHALQELSGVLSDCLDSCELNLNCIQIVSDNYSPIGCDMTHLPEYQKVAIYSMNFTNSIMLKILATTWEMTPEEVAREVTKTLTGGTLVSADELDRFAEAFVETAKLMSRSPGAYIFKEIG